MALVAPSLTSRPEKDVFIITIIVLCIMSVLWPLSLIIIIFNQFNGKETDRANPKDGKQK